MLKETLFLQLGDHNEVEQVIRAVLARHGESRKLAALMLELYAANQPFVPELQPLDYLGLRRGTRGKLEQAGIAIVGALLKQTRAKLLQIPGFTANDLANVRERLEEIGFVLSGDEVQEVAGA